MCTIPGCSTRCCFGLPGDPPSRCLDHKEAEMVNVTIERRPTIGGVIYCLIINERPYIGQSRVLNQDKYPEKRVKRHLADSKSGDHLPVHRAISKYGIGEVRILQFISLEVESNGMADYLNEVDDDVDATTVEFLDDDNPLKDLIQRLNEAETRWVSEFNAMIPEKGGGGWNCAPPGGALEHPPHTEEHKRYMSQLMSGRKLAQSTKDKISEFRKGRPLAPNHRAAIKATLNSNYFATFEDRLNEWVEQYTTLGRLPNANNPCPKEKLAANWRAVMLKKKDQGELPSEIEERLSATPSWIWKIPRGRKSGSKNKSKDSD
jgi:hypothetical protein